MEPVLIEWLGRVDYETAWQHQKNLVAALHTQPNGPHRLLLLEHPPTYTFGRRGKLENLIFDEQQLAAAGIAVHWVDRGGDVTYHGPGQLVGYPILNLARLQQRDYPDLHKYLRDLEQSIIDTLAHYAVAAWRYPGYTGVWVTQQTTAMSESAPHKIAAIGVKVSGQAISSHGFALNVAPNLAHFAGIIPCGISEHAVTSLTALTGTAHQIQTVLPHYINAFCRTFNLQPTLQSVSR